jgi:regulator of sigma D
MNEDEMTASERRGDTSQVISSMLAERNQLLSFRIECSAFKSGNTADLDREVLNEFCQILVDYIASGHFGLYERIVEGTERRRGVADLAVKLYPLIDETTQITLPSRKNTTLNWKLWIFLIYMKTCQNSAKNLLIVLNSKIR